MMSLVTRRDHLLAVNARLTLSLGSQSNSPHHSPHMAAAAVNISGMGASTSTAGGAADELTQLRSLAASSSGGSRSNPQIAKPQPTGNPSNSVIF